MKNIVFDLGGVLVDLDVARCRQAFLDLGMPQLADLIDGCHPAELFARFEEGRYTFAETCDAARRLTGRPEVPDEAIARAYTALIDGIPLQKIRMVGHLRDRGVRTYVLSNNNPVSMEVIRRMFAADGRPMEEYFDKMYLSYEMKLLKPSAEIFRTMLADSGMKPEETLFIDDSPVNAEAARQLGLSVYVPAPHEDFAHLFEA